MCFDAYDVRQIYLVVVCLERVGGPRILKMCFITFSHNSIFLKFYFLGFIFILFAKLF